MKIRTCITLPGNLLAAIDRTGSNRSQFIEKAARQYLITMAKARQRTMDAAILDKFADQLNEEATDVLDYQSIPE
ncbi:MAG: CopG family ribbon-helix-helix protein [Bryobacteraceae bacterium]|jgi:metal-responsive CopG/Arc/MetJ family transcriptional regulator